MLFEVVSWRKLIHILHFDHCWNTRLIFDLGYLLFVLMLILVMMFFFLEIVWRIQHLFLNLCLRLKWKRPERRSPTWQCLALLGRIWEVRRWVNQMNQSKSKMKMKQWTMLFEGAGKFQHTEIITMRTTSSIAMVIDIKVHGRTLRSTRSSSRREDYAKFMDHVRWRSVTIWRLRWTHCHG